MIKVALLEFERGWGSRIDEIKEFPTIDEAKTFVDEFNSVNDKKEAPDWYMVAEIL